MLGSASCGKTSLLIRFVDEVFQQDSLATVGVELKSLTLKVDGTDIRMQVWDTSGQENYLAITRQYFRGCQGAMVVFDLTKRDTFN